MPVDLDLSGPERRLRDIARALRTQEDDKQLRKDLARNLRTALQPARQQARAAIRSMPSQTKHPGRSLRSAIASKIQVVAKMAGKSAGARAITKTIKLRGFTHAPRRTNSAAGWSHPNWDHGTESHQIGKPDWFDDAMRGAAMDARRRVVDAMEDTARRLSRKV